MRDSTVDLMKGIGILAVIFGHLQEIPYMPYRNIVFSFHMPLFFLISGFFFKQLKPMDSAKRDFERLIKPYYITCIILLVWIGIKCFLRSDWKPFLSSFVASLYGSGSVNRSTFLGHVPMIGAIWFLLALFWCKNVFNFICYKYKGKEKYVSALFIAVFSIILDRYIINLPFALLPGCSALTFFVIGNVLKTVRCGNIIKYSCLVSCVLCWFYCLVYSQMSMVRSYYSNYPIDVLGACGGIYIVYLIAKLLINLPIINSFFIWIGRNSLALLCFHLFEMNSGILYLLNIPPGLCLMLAKFLFVLLVGYICSFIPYVHKVFGYS